MRVLRLLALLLVPFMASAPSASGQTGPGPSQPVTVFAAASLTDALKDLGALWVKSGHPPVSLSFGASSTLARQIEQGAPANLFASADQRWMDYLAKRNAIVPETRRNLLGNDLVLVVPADQPRSIDLRPGVDLNTLLGVSGRIAIADPTHVPAGLYARQALTSLGIWDRLAPRIAPAEDVRAALFLVGRGEAPAGIVYATDAAVSRAVRVAGVFPPASHDPITYPFAVTREGDTPETRALLTWLGSQEAMAVWLRRGFKME